MSNHLRRVTLVLKDPENPDIRKTGITILTALRNDEIIPAIKASVQSYLNTPKGMAAYERNNKTFNYEDFDLYVPNEFCKPHGIVITREHPEIIEDNLNTQLVKNIEI